MGDNISNRERQLCLEQLFAAQGRMITVFLFTLLGSWDEASELCQETFIVAFRKFGDYDPTRPAGAWLRGIARNLARNALRKRGRYRRLLARHRQVENILALWTTGGGDKEQLDELSRALARCVEKLTPRQKQVLRLTYELGMSARQTAARLKIKAGTVCQLLWQARSALRDCLAAGKPEGRK